MERVRLLEVLCVPGTGQCLRLALEGDEGSAVIPGQYCLLGPHGGTLQPYSYISLPEHHGPFIVSASHPGRFTATEGWLDYQGPLGIGWPLPLRAGRVLVLASGSGLLSVVAAIDELACWMPGLHLDLIADAASLAGLPPECRRSLHSLGLLDEKVHGACLLERLHRQLLERLPDVVFCATSDFLGRSAAQACLRSGVPATRIWLRSERLPSPPPGQAPAEGPVVRFDRLPAPLHHRS